MTAAPIPAYPGGTKRFLGELELGWSTALALLAQLVIGAIGGAVFGYGGRGIMRIFAGTTLAGGSGFLAVPHRRPPGLGKLFGQQEGDDV